jgi:hypothetical protein
MNKKKFLFIILLFAGLGVSSYYLWKQFTMVNEPVMDYGKYRFELDSIKNVKASLVKERANVAELKRTFIDKITKKIFPYWYGTAWDYNGTTQKPHEGSIACGYFVTTTLRDMGVPINRVKMAQCASEEMIRSLTTKANIHHCSGITLAEFEKKLRSYGNGLYIIGLDNHTGYILMSEAGNYFIHSSGWFPYKVVKDKLSESNILSRSKYRVVGKISDDETFLKRWLEGE